VGYLVNYCLAWLENFLTACMDEAMHVCVIPSRVKSKWSDVIMQWAAF